MRRETEHPLAAAVSVATSVGLLLALLFATVEGGIAGVAVVPLALALYAPLGIVLGLAVGAIWGGIAAVRPPDWRLFSALRDDRVDRAVTAGVAAVALALALEGLLVFAFAAGPAAGMARRELAALSTALVAVVGAGFCGLLFFPLAQLLRPVAHLVPRLGRLPRTIVAGGLGALLALLALLWAVSRADWRVLRFGPYAVLAALAGGLLLGTWWLSRRQGVWRRLRMLVLAVVVGAVLAGFAPALGRRPDLVSAAQERGTLLPLLVDIGRRLGDGDGDGYSRWLNGGDCDDSNPAVHPGARDIPGNGIDENCQGGDARRRTKTRVAATRPASRPATPTVRNLLLVCVDTLRADRLGVNGHEGGLTPRIDALARRGVLFRRAYSQGPNTPQSFPSVFTSQYSTRIPFRRRFTGYPRIKPSADSVFERLAAAGLLTTAFSSHFYFTAKRGIRQGFVEWDNRGATSLRDSNKDIAAPRIVPRAVARLKQLAAAKRRFAMFVHLFEPHSTYVRHRGFRYTKRGVAGLREKYDLEIKFADSWLGKLLDGLREAGLDDETAVLFFSDHGEAFGEHRFYFHGQALYEEVLRVPLIVVVPKMAPRVVDARVALLDIAPTMLELVGAPVPESYQGRSLLPLARGGKAPAGRRIGAVLLRYPAWPKGQRAVVLGRYKALMRTTENRFEVYDLENDPSEKKNLARSDRELARKIRAEYVRFVEEELQ